MPDFGGPGALFVVPPQQTETVVRDAAEAGIRHVWLQQGAESAVAIRFCREQGLDAVSGHCILMFAEPVGAFHRFHGWLWRVLGRAPK